MGYIAVLPISVLLLAVTVFAATHGFNSSAAAPQNSAALRKPYTFNANSTSAVQNCLELKANAIIRQISAAAGAMQKYYDGQVNNSTDVYTWIDVAKQIFCEDGLLDAFVPSIAKKVDKMEDDCDADDD